MIKVGIIGLDTSHVSAFAKLLHDRNDPYYLGGAEIVVAYPGGSKDFALSVSRVEGYTNELRDQYGIRIASSIEEVASACDLILLESVDGTTHLEDFRRLVTYGKPVFIDKPLAASYEDASEILALAKSHAVPLMSCSSLRFAEAFTRAIRTSGMGRLMGLDVYGPMAVVEKMPGLFWYGVHCAEMLVAGLGLDFDSVDGSHTERYDFLSIRWADGRVGTIRGSRSGNHSFGGVAHFEGGSVHFQLQASDRPYYASLLEMILRFFEGEDGNAPAEEALAVCSLLEEGNEVLGYSLVNAGGAR